MAAPDRTMLVCFGHHRCGTTWLTRVMEQMAAALGRRFVETSEVHTERSLCDLVEASGPEVLAVRNATPDCPAALPSHRGFHVIRDPRDIVVSGYWSHRFSHPVTDDWHDLPELREELEELSLSEGLLREIEYEAGTFDALRRWPYGRPDVLELRLEELMADPIGGVLRIGEHLHVVDQDPVGGRRAARYLVERALVRAPARSWSRHPRWRVRIPRDAWLGLAWDNRFEALAGRRPGDEDVRSHFRRGTPGSWREVFTPALVTAFKDRHPGLVEALGYESGPDWAIGDQGHPHAAR